MLAYVVAHMLGNLKIFFGETDYNGYADWLRTIGEPALHHAWFLWIIRVVLTVAWWRTSGRPTPCPGRT